MALTAKTKKQDLQTLLPSRQSPNAVSKTKKDSESILNSNTYIVLLLWDFGGFLLCSTHKDSENMCLEYTNFLQAHYSAIR